ncbi:hypothetical protein [Microbispora sp. H11081]|uniref:hypothetical protein n=1 Tax=Microbispora sp. H11081 TaxID=2729107 RepID=UPI001472E055|nr:hypothetical protein [Microbispora sp. H11081]
MIIAELACSAAGSRLVVDHIDGRPSSPARVVLAVLRRPHAFLLLAAEFTLAAGALIVLVVVVAELVESIVMALILVAVAGLFTLPALLGSGPPRSVTVSEIAVRSAPGLALDAAGRPILAGYDTEDLRVTVLACEDVGCARRPRIVWYGTPDRGGTPTYHVLTCADPYCRKS